MSSPSRPPLRSGGVKSRNPPDGDPRGSGNGRVLGFEIRLEDGNPGSPTGKASDMLDMARSSEAVKPRVCEQPVEGLGITPRPDPTHLVVRWRGSEAPSVQPFHGHDVTFAYIMSEHMQGLREGSTIVLYACSWQHSVWGRC